MTLFTHLIGCSLCVSGLTSVPVMTENDERFASNQIIECSGFHVKMPTNPEAVKRCHLHQEAEKEKCVAKNWPLQFRLI